MNEQEIEIANLKAELIGMHTGDGTLYRTKSTLVWELRGALDERQYYDYKVSPLLNKLFGKTFVPKFRSGGKNGCYGIQTSKKKVTEFFISVGFTSGRKTKTVQIADQIFYSEKEQQCAYIRGLFDTDGCLRFDRFKRSIIRKYPKIEFASASSRLIIRLSELLDNLKFRNYIWRDNNCMKLCIAGKDGLERWFNEIKPNNPKHLYKYQIFTSKGQYP